MREGREGDWECGSCRNRNYAFRSLCNRCKQPRLLVDTKTPADSKWLPRIGDWICTGCSNNNYASRDKCKKCGQLKEETAVPAIAMQGSHMPSYSNYFSRMEGLLDSRMNFEGTRTSTFQQWMMGNSPFQQSLRPLSAWPSMMFSGGGSGDVTYLGSSNHLLEIPTGWRHGDWICKCGFHNYSSRVQCKECNEPVPSNMHPSAANSTGSNLFRGTKRLASEEFVNDWDKKRLNAGDVSYRFAATGPQEFFQSSMRLQGIGVDHAHELHSNYSGKILSQMSSQLSVVPAILGKGAKQWREGDWMCQICNNHNYASRSCCNRCKTAREAAIETVE
ncbi:hypothetical protein HPP92_006876 [Vanilla planifolia]|uniref:RanBP2-type domain-containing protein n=1 Tax=Vanilla planifolia TaxID=51239 RepID=A0A835VA36_VANPL|nr:hypothetical protein HPP92_007113 [Vanilla planifolia]KAG0490013.1 hypothetical protein HPP92_006876 [Vanilla planifolia]